MYSRPCAVFLSSIGDVFYCVRPRFRPFLGGAFCADWSLSNKLLFYRRSLGTRLQTTFLQVARVRLGATHRDYKLLYYLVFQIRSLRWCCSNYVNYVKIFFALRVAWSMVYIVYSEQFFALHAAWSIWDIVQKGAMLWRFWVSKWNSLSNIVRPPFSNSLSNPPLVQQNYTILNFVDNRLLDYFSRILKFSLPGN